MRGYSSQIIKSCNCINDRNIEYNDHPIERNKLEHIEQKDIHFVISYEGYCLDIAVSTLEH